MLELGTFGSVRGVPGNGRPYRDPRSVPVVLISGTDFVRIQSSIKSSTRRGYRRGRACVLHWLMTNWC